MEHVVKSKDGGPPMTMQQRIESLDWAATNAGSFEDWPQSLKATIKTILGSRYPMILLWGEDLIQIYNDAYTNLIGDKHPYALGRSIMETQAESWSTIGPMIHHVMSTGEPNWVPAQLLAVNRSGFDEETYFSLSYSAVENDENKITGMLCVCSEVTSQVIGERRLRLQRDLAARSSESRSVEKVCTDIAAAISNYPFDVPFLLLYLQNGDTTPVLFATVGVDNSDIPEPAKSLFQIERAVNGESVITTGVQEYIINDRALWKEPINHSITLPIPAGAGRLPLGVLVAGISPNIPWDDQYEYFFHVLADQVSVALRNAIAYEEERKRAEELASIDRAKTAFFSNVSHEFRTPLTLILGPLEEVFEKQSPSLPRDVHEALNVVYENALRLLKLVNSLLDFSRIESNRAEPHFVPVNLSDITAELASAFESAFKKANLSYHVETTPFSQPVCVDTEMWEKIIFNLLSNAVKFTFEGSVTVQLKEEDQWAVLTVSDTGVGIPKAELPNVFKRFYRLHNTGARSHEGSGIGLALVQELVKLHKGQISVASEQGKGSVFTVWVPKNLQRTPSVESFDTEDSFSDIVRQSFTNEALLWTGGTVDTTNLSEPLDPATRVLVVDDNPQMLQYLCRILATHYRVETARDGVEAIASIKRNKPDLIVSDVMMPNIDGFQLLAKVRENNEWDDLPIILLSARAGKEATIEGLQKGANDYLVKPFYADELVARVAAQLDIRHTKLDNALLERKVKERTLELTRINQELDQFATVASHDLQEPLRKIIIYSNRLSEILRSEQGPAADYLKKILSAGMRMRSLITELLNFSRLTDADGQFTAVNLNDIFAQVVSDLDELIRQKRAKIMIDKLPNINGVSVQLYQLFFNLVSNSLKFTSPERDPVISISAEISPHDDGASVTISVKDNGIGFDIKYAGNIFKIFNRLHQQQQYEGTGIGLALCKKIVLNHKGEIYATAEPGNGAQFFVRLPLSISL